jgi:hypothetical protein
MQLADLAAAGIKLDPLLGDGRLQVGDVLVPTGHDLLEVMDFHGLGIGCEPGFTRRARHLHGSVRRVARHLPGSLGGLHSSLHSIGTILPSNRWHLDQEPPLGIMMSAELALADATTDGINRDAEQRRGLGEKQSGHRA